MVDNLKTPVLDYDNRDFESVRDDVLERVVFFTPEWTDLNPNDFGVVLTELFAGMADILHYYVDSQANECYLPSVKTRRAARFIAEPLGSQFKSAVPAKVDLTFTLAAIEVSDVTIPAGTRVSTSGIGTIVQFETDVVNVIPAGELVSSLVPATEGDTQSEGLGTSDGSAFQVYESALNSVIDDSWEVEVGGAVIWTSVPSLITFGPEDEVYQVRRDEDDIITIEFGDGINGKIPQTGDDIDLTARVGGGRDGNVSSDTIQTVVDVLPVTVTVNNDVAASGGEERESLEDFKTRVPLEFRSLERAVTLEDWEGLIAAVAGVFRVQARVESVGLVGLYIAPAGGGEPSTGLITTVETRANEIRIATDAFEANPATYIDIDITGTVTVLQNFVQSVVEAAVLEAIDEFLDIENRVFGEVDSPAGDIRESDVFALIEEIEGVDFVELDVLTLVPAPVFIVATGDAEFGPISASLTTVPEVWTINFTSATTFTARGSVSGLQVAVGIVGTPYTSDNGEVAFTISNTGAPMAANDRAEFRVSELKGSVDILPTEIGQKGPINMSFLGGV